MKPNIKTTLLGLLLVVALIAILVAFLLAPKAQAQPYFTNTAPFGAAAYNTSLATPLNPQVTLSNQWSAGTLAGVVPTNQVAYFLYTNTFASPTPFTTAPYVVCSAGQSGIITNAVVTIVSTSTTNFVCQVTPTNVPIYWEATGH